MEKTVSPRWTFTCGDRTRLCGEVRFYTRDCAAERHLIHANIQLGMHHSGSHLSLQFLKGRNNNNNKIFLDEGMICKDGPPTQFLYVGNTEQHYEEIMCLREHTESSVLTMTHTENTHTQIQVHIQLSLNLQLPDSCVSSSFRSASLWLLQVNWLGWPDALGKLSEEGEGGEVRERRKERKKIAG